MEEAYPGHDHARAKNRFDASFAIARTVSIGFTPMQLGNADAARKHVRRTRTGCRRKLEVHFFVPERSAVNARHARFTSVRKLEADRARIASRKRCGLAAQLLHRDPSLPAHVYLYVG
jgi:hypothetical protein